LNPIADEDGTYQILVTDTDNGCSAISTVVVNIDTQTPAAVANAPTQLSCTSTSVSLDGNGSSTGSDFIYEWTTSDGNIISGINSLTPEVNTIGTYQIMVTNTVNGCTQVAFVDVLLDGDLPGADAGVADDLTCVTDQVTLNGVASTGTNFTYLWTTSDGNIVSGDDGLNPIVDGTGTYQLLVSDTDNGCTAISTVLVEEDMGGTTYSIQYRAKSREDLESYYKHDADRLRNEGLSKFADKMLAFRTELEIIDEYSVNFN